MRHRTRSGSDTNRELRRMRIAHVIPSFYPAFVYGGPVKSVFQLCCYLTKLGVEVRVLTTDANGRKALGVATGRETEVAPGLRVRYCKRLSRDAVSPSLLALLPSYIRWSDVI